MKDRTKNIAFCGVCAAGAMILSYIEALLPPVSAALPGVRLGLANIVVIFVLFRLGTRSAAAVSATRLALTAILFGNAVSLIYSFTGAVLSLLIMTIAECSRRFSVAGVSVLGGVSHNAGQLIAAVLLTSTAEVALYFPVLVISGTVSGIFIGLCGAMTLKILRNVKI